MRRSLSGSRASGTGTAGSAPAITYSGARNTSWPPSEGGDRDLSTDEASTASWRTGTGAQEPGDTSPAGELSSAIRLLALRNVSWDFIVIVQRIIWLNEK